MVLLAVTGAVTGHQVSSDVLPLHVQMRPLSHGQMQRSAQM